ncbi:gluconokinase [Penicillium lagena]|uniref:gluconokinase n=1 Tax=Penicillium lagena TaxID=94218 RepID=UPI00254018BE|nr:gluconokinase [Penicillium lagena]KAJ5623781.1 gluconokinase [Penicillium lagena]
MLVGDRPQPRFTPAIVDPPITHVMPALNAGSSTAPSATGCAEKSTKPMLQHIWIVTGPAGCGKSTVGEGLRQELGVPFLEGDDYHPQLNKEKMGRGTPLTDEDRWDWLIALRKAAIDVLAPSPERNNPAGVVVACSALKQKYRDVMRVAAYGSPSVQIHFIYLQLDEDVLMARVRARQQHYMKSGMVRSQLATLEEPKDEWDAITINVQGPPEEVQKRVHDAVTAKLAEYV